MTIQLPENPSPSNTKESRESLHDTSNATDSVKDWRTFWKDVLDKPDTKEESTTQKQRLVNDFADSICCALEEMNGEEIFECFFEAALERHQYAKKEYDKANQLISKFTNE